MDREPYENTQDTALFTELADDRPSPSGTGKYYLPEFEAERDHFLRVNGKNPWPNIFEPVPLPSMMWQIIRKMTPDSDGNINFKLYEVSRVTDHYTFAGQLITDNVVAVGVQHSQ